MEVNQNALKEVSIPLKGVVNLNGIKAIFVSNLESDDITKEILDTATKVAAESTIYFNDLSEEYWIYDFKVKNLWFSSKYIDTVKKIILLEVFK